MKLREKLIDRTILVPMIATNKEDANQELLAHLQSMNILSATDRLLDNINKQEEAFTSSVGRGVAYPHSTSVEVDELTCVLGLSQQGIDYNSPDGQYCHLILLTLSPVEDPTEHRKFISRFQTMFRIPEIRSSLFESKNCDDILNIIYQWEENNNDEDTLV